jgi:hypothetical protein
MFICFNPQTAPSAACFRPGGWEPGGLPFPVRKELQISAWKSEHQPKTTFFG